MKESIRVMLSQTNKDNGYEYGDKADLIAIKAGKKEDNLFTQTNSYRIDTEQAGQAISDGVARKQLSISKNVEEGLKVMVE